MKKITLLFLLFVGIQALTFAREIKVESDTIRSKYKLDSVRRAEYEKFENTFNSWFYKVYCVKMKIKISCAGCSRFFAPITFKVDSTGKIKVIETGKGLFCGKELNEKQKTELLKGFNKITFSELFYGRIVFFNFNRSLSC